MNQSTITRRYLREMEIVLQQSALRTRKVGKDVQPVKRTEALAGFLSATFSANDMKESPLHGVAHWHRVFSNGIELAETEAYANKHTALELSFTSTVVTLFSLFHDSRREDEDEDPYHGARAATRIECLRAPLLEFFHPTVLDVVRVACKVHTALQHPGPQHRLIRREFAGLEDCASEDIKTHAVGLCLDADRLDLPRVGIMPHPRFLFSETAIKKATAIPARA